MARLPSPISRVATLFLVEAKFADTIYVWLIGSNSPDRWPATLW
jgi:hypothetical protein